MVREAKREDLDSLLKLYLFLHEERIPDHDRHLTETWGCFGFDSIDSGQ